MTRSVSWTQTGRAGAPTPQASREAFEWYRRAAEQGHLDAQFAMSVMYEQGKGIDSNPGHALFWVRRMRSKTAGAQLRLACRYEAGAGVEQDGLWHFIGIARPQSKVILPRSMLWACSMSGVVESNMMSSRL